MNFPIRKFTKLSRIIAYWAITCFHLRDVRILTVLFQIFAKNKHIDEGCFASLHHLPFPMPKITAEKSKHFNEVFGSSTTQNHRPNLIEKEKSSHQLPFSPSSQAAKNTNAVVQCDECGKWRCMYSKLELKKYTAVKLNRFNQEFVYSCGTVPQDIVLYDVQYSNIIANVFVKANLTRCSPIEIPFYSSCNDPICFYCGCEEENSLEKDDAKYPICKICISKKLLPVDKRTRSIKPKK